MNKLAMAALKSYDDESADKEAPEDDSGGDLESEMAAFCAAEGKKDYAAMARAFREAARLAK